METAELARPAKGKKRATDYALVAAIAFEDKEQLQTEARELKRALRSWLEKRGRRAREVELRLIAPAKLREASRSAVERFLEKDATLADQLRALDRFEIQTEGQGEGARLALYAPTPF